MHASIWRYRGDPDDLLARYEASLAAVPSSTFVVHLCLRAPDGMIVVDTCPSREAFEGFAAGPFPELRARFGLPDPDRVDDFPVHAAFADGARVV